MASCGRDVIVDVKAAVCAGVSHTFERQISLVFPTFLSFCSGGFVGLQDALDPIVQEMCNIIFISL